MDLEESWWALEVWMEQVGWWNLEGPPVGVVVSRVDSGVVVGMVGEVRL